MKRNGNGNGLPRQHRGDAGDAAAPFMGFTPLDANFLYCPNQFLDLCLPFHSRGCVRLVGYLFRKTLGWRDELGRPLQIRIPVSYQTLIAEAGISRGAVRDALDEALKSRFVTCTTTGHAHREGEAAQSASYELKWDHGSEFAKSMTEFNGFFAGEGHRTPIPNDFFDVVIPGEPLAVIRVVGAVIRKTIGYQDQFGGRRRSAPLSFTEIQRRSNIADRKTISQAIQRGIESNYITLFEEGRFDPNGGERNLAASYGIKWRQGDATAGRIGSKTQPAPTEASVQKPHRLRRPENAVETPDFSAFSTGNGSKTPPAPQSVQNPYRQRFRNPTGNGSKTQLLERGSERALDKEQQQAAVAEASLEVLINIGFTRKVAESLARRFGHEQVRRQAEWLPRRSATKNRLGLLRRAIEDDWPEPQGEVRTSEAELSPPAVFARGFYAALGDNKGKPVAEPSANDLASATRLVERAGGMIDLDSAEQHGRTFGGLVREWRGTATSFNSLAASTRSFGDKFIARLDAGRSALERQKAQQKAAEREKQLKAGYLAYLVEREQSLRASQPDAYAEFESQRARKRAELANHRIGAKHLVAYHDSDEARLEELVAFFNQDVVNFRQWVSEQQQGEVECTSSPSSTPRAVAARVPSR